MVTKPVRTSEVVLGRMLGFTLIGTLILFVMSVVSYVFVVRGLDHTHQLAEGDLRPAGQAVKGGLQPLEGQTDLEHRHRHHVRVDSKGEARVDEERGHEHEIEVSRSSDGKAVYRLGPPVGMLEAHVPMYGKLRFRNDRGIDTDKGINVGDEWMYRSFIAGDSQAAAIWTFQGINESKFPTGLPVEMNIEIFRTYKGDIEKGVMGALGLRNPKTGLYVEVHVFEAKEYTIKQLLVPRTITKANMARADMIARHVQGPDGVELDPPEMDSRLAKGKEFDLYRDLVDDNGEVEIWLRCVDHSQYFGAGPVDMYIRAEDVPFFVNFFKGYFGIWLQMVLIVAYGVMFSTFVSGPIAMLATFGALIGGMSSEFLEKLALHQQFGGGPFEAIVRLLTQNNLMTELPPSMLTTAVQMADKVAERLLLAIAAILPPFERFSYADHVANGFDITMNPYIADPATMALGYVLPVFVAGYLFLKTREVAR